MKNGHLYLKSQMLETSTVQSTLQDFKTWLGKLVNPVIASHNGHNFDLLEKYLISNCVNLDISCFVDTLDVFKDILKDRKSFSQESLAKESGEIYNVHCALDDAKSLQKLLSIHKIGLQHLLKHGVTHTIMCMNFTIYNVQT